MKINNDIKNALKEAICEAGGTQELFSKKCGIPQNYLSNYLTGAVNSIDFENWWKLSPHLKKFLPEYMKKYCFGGDCEELCDGLNPIDKGLFKIYKSLSKEGRKKIRDVAEEEYIFQLGKTGHGAA